MTETKLQLEDWLDDLCVRFIINLPEEDLSSVARICFQVEEAQWFYEDFIRPLDPTLPSMSLRSFCLRIFQHCPLLSAFSADNHMRAFEEFLTYKTRVPVRGAIMLNQTMDSVVLVKGWKKGANWSFPRGKINKDEDDLDCAVREVYEETGFDIKEAGLVPKDDGVKYIEITMREQHMRLYVFRNVPMDTHFEPRTRKEISKIQWYRLSDLPAFRKKGQGQNENYGAEPATNANKFYMVAPFLVPLKKWVAQQKKKDAQRLVNNQYLIPNYPDDIPTEEEQGLDKTYAYTSESAPENEQTPVLAPGIDTMEGATAALHRLLKIQPPTQGLQPEAASAVPSPASHNSGEALLALLQSKPRLEAQPGAIPPQTPLDLTITDPPMPKTPHHQPQPARINSIPTPPSFPFPPSGHGHVNAQQNQMQHLRYQNLVDSQPLFQYDQQNIPQQHNPQRFQSQQLQHPQPLPPNISRAVFTGASHAPTMPPTFTQSLPPSSDKPHEKATTQPHFQGIHAPVIPSTTRPPPPKLNSHSLALLNAFKGSDQNGPGLNNENALNGQKGTQDPPLPEKSRDLAINATKADEIFPEMSGIGVSSINSVPTKPVANEQHRSSLLDMFKGANASPVSNVEITAPLRVAAEQDKTTKRVELPANGKAENSPFKPLTILTRPAIDRQTKNPQPSNKIRGEGSSASRKKPSKASSNAGAKTPRKSAENGNAAKPFQPQILKRPQTQQVRDNPIMPAELASSSPISDAEPLKQLPQQPSLDRRGSQPVGQKQALLSLFGKAPVGSSSAHDPSITPRTPEHQPDIDLGFPNRSRVSSLASARPDALSDSSRRGSQHTLSPANKGFLLGYLNALADNTH